jgi:hypothetical protein
MNASGIVRFLSAGVLLASSAPILSTGSAAASPPAPAVPTVVRAELAPEWDARFAGKEGWVGGDAVYSAVLGRDRVLWLFGDSLLGTARDGRRDGAVMVNNVVAVQTGVGRDAAVRFIPGKADGRKPAAFFLPSDDKGWLWPQGAVRAGDRLLVFLPQIERGKGSGAFGFRHVAEWLAVVENPDDEPERWRVKQHRLPFATFGPDRERSWGSAVLEDGNYLYIYGYDEERGKGAGKRRLTVARVPAGKADDLGAWRFRTADGWGDKPEDAVPLADGLATEFSVSRAPGGTGYVAVYTENGLGERILGRFAGAPDGPWSAPVLLYQCSEMRKDKGVFSYSAKAHPWAAGDDELLVSYCVNAWEFARLFRDDAVYRPRFVRVKLGPPR